MTVNLSAYTLLVFAYFLMAFNCYLLIREYEKLNKENEELKESIVILKNWIEEKLDEVDHDDIRLEDIKEAIHRMDLLMRPYVVFMSPENYEAIKAMFPNFEDEYQVQTVEWLENDKCILIPRKELEEWRFGKIEFEEVEHE